MFAQWLEERCDLGERHTAPTGALYKSWSEYAKVAGEEPGTSKSFASEMQRRGFTPGKSNGVRIYRSLSRRYGDDDV